MRFFTAIPYLIMTALLVSCDQQPAAPDIDPALGFECFEQHRAAYPPGAQYEGIDKVADNTLTIKIMNGVELVTVDCTLTPDGTLK